jgi:ribose transport system permease protein
MSTATPSGATRSPEEDDRARAEAGPIGRWLRSSGAWVLILDAALIAYFGLASTDHVFLSVQNFQAMALNGTEALLLALGLCVLLGAGIFDLSLGANLVLSSVIGAKVMIAISGAATATGAAPDAGGAIALGLGACLAAGMTYGLINGLIVGYLGVNSLIATLGTTGIGTGIALLITDGADVSGLPLRLQTDFGLATVAGIPLPAVMAVAAAAILWATLRYLRFGTYTLAIGSSRPAAERAGIHVRRHMVALMVLAGSLAGLAAFADLAHYGATTVQGHTNDALAAVTAVVIGGTLLDGGRVSVSGTVFGTVLAVVLQSGLVVIGVKSYWQLIAVGCVLVVAVALDQLRQRRREQR